MIVSRTPLRISFLGGRTDLPSFFREEEGAVVSCTINKYIHVILRDGFDEKIRLSYSRDEICRSPSEIQHPILRQIMSVYEKRLRELAGGRGIEILSMSDVPAGTGMGSSSAFTVCVLHALKARLGVATSPETLAAEAARIEIDELKEPIGKQDQYVTALGGLQYVRFLPSGEVVHRPVACSQRLKREMQASIVLFYTGITRSASAILSVHETLSSEKRDRLREMKRLAERLKDSLESNGSVREFGDLLRQGWSLKKTMGSGISAPQIDDWYERAMKAGAWGGKILGAGGGGFLMVLAHPDKHAAIRAELNELRCVPVELETETEKAGTRIVYVG